MAKAAKTKQIIKSANDGQFKSKEFLKAHPKEVYKQTVPIKGKTKK